MSPTSTPIRQQVTFTSDVDVELINSAASDASVVLAARVSTAGEASTTSSPERDAGLINYLVRDRHGSPFEHTFFTFRLKAPLPVGREFFRHRAGWSYNEESGRYREYNPEFYVMDPEVRKLQQSGKVGHYIFAEGTYEQKVKVPADQRRIAQYCWDTYCDQIEMGVAKEVARYVLPLNLMSSMYTSCNARSLMHFLSLRTEWDTATYPSHPMREIAMVGDKMEAFFAEAMPATYAAFLRAGRVAP